MRAALAFLALAGLAGPALAQTCIEGPGGMRMCDNGFMSMGGMSMQLPTPPAVPPAVRDGSGRRRASSRARR